MNAVQTVQLSLFSRGDAISKAFAESVIVIDRVKKDKDKQIVRTEDGKAMIASQTIKLLPRKSTDKADLADLTGLTGQALMGFELEARGALLQSSFSHLSRLVASGNYTFDMSRVNLANGKFMLSIKPAIGKTAILSPAELAKQAKELGYTLVPTEKPSEETEAPPATAPAPVPQNGPVEVVVVKGKKKKAVGSAAATV